MNLDIGKRFTPQAHIDQWDEAKTKGLNDYQKYELKKQWGTMQAVLSSASNMQAIAVAISQISKTY